MTIYTDSNQTFAQARMFSSADVVIVIEYAVTNCKVITKDECSFVQNYLQVKVNSQVMEPRIYEEMHNEI